MSVIIATCPHCFKENVAFRSVGEHRLTDQKPLPFLFTVFFVCGNCEGGMAAKVGQFQTPQSPHQYPTGLELNEKYLIMDRYPLPAPITLPEYLPDNIRTVFKGAADNLRIHSTGPKGEDRCVWDGAAMLCRKALEMSCKILGPDFSGGLEKRINMLAERSLITRQLAEWAHEIRIDGNFAAHELEPVTEAFAKELFNFTEIFLMYVFTLPGMLAARRFQKPD